MKTLDQSTFLRYLTLGALYLGQGIPWGFISVGYVVFLADQGLDNTAVGGLVSLAYLPWSFKIVWGPVLDRFPSRRFGRRRPYIVVAELLMGLTLLSLLLVDPRNLMMVSVLLFLNNTFASLQDVAVDALAVDVLKDHERTKANSIMWASKLGGTFLGGSGGLLMAKALGWSSVFLLMAIAIWLIMLLPLLILERARPSADADMLVTRLETAELKRAFESRAARAGILLAFLGPTGYALISTFHTRMLRADLGMSEEQIATLAGIDPLAGVAGAVVGGVLAIWLEQRRLIAVCCILLMAVMLSFAGAQPLWSHFAFMAAFMFVFHFTIGIYSVATLGLFMGLSNPAIGATHFALYMAGTNLCYTWTSTAGGWMADHWGYVSAYAVAAVAQLIGLAILPFCRVQEAQASFARESSA